MYTYVCVWAYICISYMCVWVCIYISTSLLYSLCQNGQPESHKKPSDKHKWKDILHDIWSICSRNVKGMKVLKRPEINAKAYPN